MKVVPLLAAMVLAGCLDPSGIPGEDLREWGRALQITAPTGVSLDVAGTEITVAMLKAPATVRVARYDTSGNIISHRWTNLSGEWPGEWRDLSSTPALARLPEGPLVLLVQIQDDERRFAAIQIAPDGSLRESGRSAPIAPTFHHWENLRTVTAPLATGLLVLAAGADLTTQTDSEFGATYEAPGGPYTIASIWTPSSEFSPPSRAGPGRPLAARTGEDGLVHVLSTNTTTAWHWHTDAAGRPSARVEEVPVPPDAFVSDAAFIGRDEAWLTLGDETGPHLRAGDRLIEVGSPHVLHGTDAGGLAMATTPPPAEEQNELRLFVLDDQGERVGDRSYPASLPRPAALAPSDHEAWYLLAITEDRAAEPAARVHPAVSEVWLLRLVPDPP